MTREELMKEERKAYLKNYWLKHPMPKEKRDRIKKRRDQDLNRNGVKKSNIRAESNHILKKIHAKLNGYEIHHCFSYEDPNKFIYIPRNLHLQIHKLLKDKNISASLDHWTAIRDLVNGCEHYTYIRC